MAKSQTLYELLADRVIPLPEALRRGIEIAQILRQMHDQDRIQGVLTPDLVLYTSEGIQLVSAEEAAVSTECLYTAPEVANGQAPDVCSDIFAFGALFYRILVGSTPYRARTPVVGERQLDRLVRACLSHERSERPQNMQQVITELRLIGVSLRGGTMEGTPGREELKEIAQREFRQLEQSLTIRMEQHLAEMALSAKEQVLARHGAMIQVVSETLTAMHMHLGDGGSEIVAEIRRLQDSSNQHGLAIESARASAQRTDDMLKQLIEAVESLQTIVLEEPTIRDATHCRPTRVPAMQGDAA